MTRSRAEEILATGAPAEEPSPRAPRQVPRGRRGPREPLPADVKALLAGMVVVAIAAVGWLAFGPEPEPIVPVLGFVDAAPPPVPRPTPTPEPPFKLPWWK